MTKGKQKRGIAYTRQNGSPVYRKCIRINGKKEYGYFSRKTDSDRWYLEKRHEKELLEAGIQTKFILRDFVCFVEEWLTARKSSNPISTWKTEEERLRGYIFPFFSGRNMHQISSGEWETFLDRLVTKRELSPSTRNRYRTLLHKIYEDALRRDHVSVNPITRIPKWKEDNHNYDYFETREECTDYLESASRVSATSCLFGSIALNIGPRLGEILALRNKDVDLPNRRIHICRTVEHATKTVVHRTKGGKDRWVPVSNSLYEVLKRHTANAIHKKPDDLLISYDDGSIFSRETLRDLHVRVCKGADLKSLRLHDLRHTFASHFVMNGGSINDLKEILGHTDIKTTMRYAHLSKSHLASKANVVSFSTGEDSRRQLQVVGG